MSWEIVDGPSRIEGQDGAYLAFTIRRGTETRTIHVMNLDPAAARGAVEAVLHLTEPPPIATFRIPIVVGQRVRYVGPGSDEPQPHESGTVVDVNQYANEVIVAWDVSSTLAHGRPEDDLEPVDS